MDFTGRYIYVDVALAKNDREMFTSSPLYLQEGQWFSDGQWIASDGGIDGDGPVRCSFKNPGDDIYRKMFNLLFRKVRAGIETAFCRVCRWFPILGVDKAKWNYDDKVLKYSVHAACRLHNWMMNTEHLSYDAFTSAENMFAGYY